MNLVAMLVAFKHGYVGKKGLFLSDFMIQIKNRVWIIRLSQYGSGVGKRVKISCAL